VKLYTQICLLIGSRRGDLLPNGEVGLLYIWNSLPVALRDRDSCTV